MAVRYSRRTSDGTLEYHDSRESLHVAQEQESQESTRILFGLLGLIVGGVLSYVAMLEVGAEWPKWMRFTLVVLGAICGATLLAKLALILSFVVRFFISAAFLTGIGWLIWLAL
jgi:hypothetical protein